METQMILEEKETFGEWIRHIRKVLSITDDSTCLYFTGLYYKTIRAWICHNIIPNMRSILKLTDSLSRATGETPQDILDTLMQSIPEWRQQNKRSKYANEKN